MKVLKFSAGWCQPCKALSVLLTTTPIPCAIEEIDIDSNFELPAQFKVRGVPTIVAVNDDGEEINRLVGSVTKQTLTNWISSTFPATN